MEIDPPKTNENQYSLVIAEQCTGIVLDPTTLKRWTRRPGSDYHVPVASLDEARQLATKIISSGAELEVVIYSNRDQSVERICNEWVAPALSPEHIERKERSRDRDSQTVLTPTLLCLLEAGICVGLGGLLGYELIPINLGADGWLAAYPQQKLHNLLFGATLGAGFFLFLWALDQRGRS